MFRLTASAGVIAKDIGPDSASKRYQSTPVPAMWYAPSVRRAAAAKLSLASNPGS